MPLWTGGRSGVSEPAGSESELQVSSVSPQYHLEYWFSTSGLWTSVYRLALVHRWKKVENWGLNAQTVCCLGTVNGGCGGCFEWFRFGDQALTSILGGVQGIMWY